MYLLRRKALMYGTTRQIRKLNVIIRGPEVWEVLCWRLLETVNISSLIFEREKSHTCGCHLDDGLYDVDWCFFKSCIILQQHERSQEKTNNSISLWNWCAHSFSRLDVHWNLNYSLEFWITDQSQKRQNANESVSVSVGSVHPSSVVCLTDMWFMW